MRKRLMLQICLAVALSAVACAAEPLGHWPFDGNLNDVAGSTDGTFAGGTPVYVPGRLDQAIRFDGTDDYVQVMVPNVSVYTLTAWIMPERTAAANVVTRTTASGPNTHWSHQLRITTSGNFEHYLYDGTGRSVVGTTLIEAGAWYFVAISATSNGPVRLYVNGQEEGTAATAGNLWTGGDRFHFGSDAKDLGWFQGIMDDVRIYQQELTEAELSALLAEAPYPFAFSPQPKNGAMLEQTSVDLQWYKGDSAVSHKVYIGESFDDVNDGTVEAIATTNARLSIGVAGGAYPAGLVPGKTYYWRVDEINDAHPDSPWKGPVWSFWLPPLTAWNPAPVPGATYVDPNQDLTWQRGMATLFHTVYFGESLEQVGEATTGGIMKPEPVYDPGTLEENRTYYWRVDEFTPTGTQKSEVWSFTTRPAIPATADPNLLLLWTLDEGPQAASAVDWSGHNKHGTKVNAPSWTPDGYHGGATVFDGSSYFYGRTAPALPTQTVCAWVRTAQAPASILGWANAHPTSGTHDKELYINADRTVSWHVYDGAAKIVTSTQPVADGTWHHVAGVYTKGATMQLYIDGVLQGSTEVGNVYAGYNTPHMTVGIDSTARKHLNGAVDDVRVYNKALSEEQLQELMRGNPLLASDPVPARNAIVEIRAIDSLRWTQGDTAASHDVYFGRDLAAVFAADKGAPEFQGNRTAANLPLAGLVEFGGGNYCWRIDEVEADGTVHAGNVWTFTVPDYLIVDDFESYDDAEDQGTRIYETWIDGWENQTGSMVGYETAVAGTFGETGIVHGGGQSMPLDYNNVNAPYYAEAERTWTAAQDWTDQDATTLTLYFRGRSGNAPEPLYVTLEDSAGKTATVVHPDPDAAQAGQWTEWSIPFSAFAAVNAGRIETMIVGLGNRANPTAGGAGLLYIDNICLTKR